MSSCPVCDPALLDLPPVMTVQQVANFLQISQSACYEAVKRGEIPTIRLGNRMRVTRAELARVLAGGQSGASTPTTPPPDKKIADDDGDDPYESG